MANIGNRSFWNLVIGHLWTWQKKMAVSRWPFHWFLPASWPQQSERLISLPIFIESIRMGNPSATDEEVYQAARYCGCYDFILNLENGFHTVVGDVGGHLSGGERQRIAIARSVYSVLTGELDWRFCVEFYFLHGVSADYRKNQKLFHRKGSRPRRLLFPVLWNISRECWL